ncbi:uncharacterized protein LOC120607935 [Pteropus medius]|uniref:uncharacterized protein LOC120607935 n=1 Tax=Pteropus vampyrus TaxID=132908 RepID=UPI00196B177F|nr:uncharacterized protein LOC120607935 [Pteropus giganteus]
MVPVKLSPAPVRGGLSSKSSGGSGSSSSGSSGSSSLVLCLSSVTGILGWIIRITLLLLKNTRSRGEYQRQAGSGRPSQPTSWPLNACGCQGLEQFSSVASEELELNRGSQRAPSAERACPWAKVLSQAAEARDLRIASPGGCWSPTPGGATLQPDVASGAGEGMGDRGLGPGGAPRLEVWRVSQEPIFSFRILREGVEKQDGNRIGCGVAQNWNLPERGWGRQCLFSRPVSLGHVFSAVFPASAFGTSLKHQQTQGTFPLSSLLRRDETKSERFPPSTSSFSFFQILMDHKAYGFVPS